MAVAKMSKDIALEAFQKLRTGFAELKTEQADSIIAVLEYKNTLIILPTGFGKTVVTAALPFAFDIAKGESRVKSMVICVAPLVALMQDQERRLKDYGLTVAILKNDDELLQKVRDGKFQILLTSPEMLLDIGNVRSMIHEQEIQEKVCALVVDEAHCISSWFVIIVFVYKTHMIVNVIVKLSACVYCHALSTGGKTSDQCIQDWEN
jgi:superfamily II DNA helicase RecQ